MRSRSFRRSVLAVSVVLSAAACTTSTDGRPQPVPTVTAAPTGDRIDVGTMHVTLPAGAKYTAHSQDGLLDGCITEGTVVCEARLLDLREATSDPNAPINLPSAKRPFGWYTGTDVPTCITAASPPGEAATATGSTLVESGFKPVGTKNAEYGRWQVSCEDATQNNEVRMWWLPTSKILVVEYGAFAGWDAKMDTLLTGATFS
ncbi:hypothetical protein OHS58_47850 [Amycolatopsis sp. NBC_00348]|uniref:hypothetical protein n=1 Tax=unclassified Amycolatopsis TaxID=2618356 RepID=UPI002E11CDC2|nr:MULTISPECIES: hypothetical protein [unclassified Amycolatopsis]WSJ77278.1 hypothetical protein OG439_49355 [Amycolatopsis sp. NBC_01307]